MGASLGVPDARCSLWVLQLKGQSEGRRESSPETETQGKSDSDPRGVLNEVQPLSRRKKGSEVKKMCGE